MTSTDLPLAGITVVALEQAVAAPLATRHLADLGARVIKVERPDGGDMARGYDDVVNGLSSHFVWLNRGKESVCLDLRSPDGREAFLALVERADVVVQNLAPGAAERLGVDADALRAHKPELIVVTISGYGPGGPMSSQKAYDLLIQAESGLMSATGTAEIAVKAGVPAADIATGMYACVSATAALVRRAISGLGSAVDVAMFDSTVEWLGHQMYTWMHSGTLIPRMGNGHATITPYTVYPTADGELFIGIQSDTGWRALVTDVLGAPELADHPSYRTNIDRVHHRSACDATIAELTSKHPTATLRARLWAAGVPNAELKTIADVIDNPQLHARSRWRDITTEAGTTRALLPPMTFRDVELAMGDVPALGQHTEAVLAELGIDPRPAMD